MGPVEFLALAYWPLVAATVFALVELWRRAGTNTKRRGALAISAAFVLFLLIILLMGVIGRRSALTLFVVNIFPLAAGVFFLTLVWIILRVPQKSRNWFAVFAVSCFGLIFAGIGSWWLAGDFLLPRQQLEGTVDVLKTNVSKTGTHYRVRLDGNSHETTADVYETLQIGERVRAEMGTATGTVFRVERLPGG